MNKYAEPNGVGEFLNPCITLVAVALASLVMVGGTTAMVSEDPVVVQNGESIPPRCIKVGLIGDSTVASTYGWGPAFAKRCNDQLTVLNFAKNGATLQSLSDRLDELLAKRPDYVLVQFGHNDQKKYGTDEYRERLKSYVDRIKQAGGQPILLSSATRRVFGADGRIKPRTELKPGVPLKADLPTFAKTVQAVAQEEQVPFIDLYSLSVAHHNRIGPEASATYNFDETDTTHFSPLGAAAIAELILPELWKAAPELRAYTTGVEEQEHKPLSKDADAANSKTIDDGSSGSYKAVAATEASLPDFVVYRPVDIDAAVEKEGKLPVLVWANGGCMDSSIHHERLLSEVASHGYVIVAIGKLQMTVDERVHKPTRDDMLLEAINWIAEQAKDSKSDYYQKVDLDYIAAGGQSCGGAQTLRVAGDPRIKTYLIFNAGMGPMTMAGASKESLKSLHGPMVYMVGGPSDIAYENALQDYDRIDTVPVAFASLDVGHGATFADQFGGSFARMALSWLDWQLKGKDDRASVFLKNDLNAFPGWTVESKNF